VIVVGAYGMVTPVGLSAPASLAAMRAGVTAFKDMPFPLPVPREAVAAFVPTIPIVGFDRYVRLLAPAVAEATRQLDDATLSATPVLVAVPSATRPDRPSGLVEDLIDQLERAIGRNFHPAQSALVPKGRIGVPLAIAQAVELIRGGNYERCIVAGVDTLVNLDCVGWLFRQDRLKCEDVTNGLIPGEAAVAIEIITVEALSSGVEIVAIGRGYEATDPIRAQPLRGDGLTQAVARALQAADLDLFDIDYRLSDVNGEQYFFKETELCVARLLRRHKDAFAIWHPADSIGDCGAAAGGILVAMAKSAAIKGYAPGPLALCQSSSDEGGRAAIVLRQIAREDT
jgi:3-oxoacyl-[acyl-carrier-protein] synthase I